LPSFEEQGIPSGGSSLPSPAEAEGEIDERFHTLVDRFHGNGPKAKARAPGSEERGPGTGEFDVIIRVKKASRNEKEEVFFSLEERRA
jgi:hypothetical protein